MKHRRYFALDAHKEMLGLCQMLDTAGVKYTVKPTYIKQPGLFFSKPFQEPVVEVAWCHGDQDDDL